MSEKYTHKLDDDFSGNLNTTQLEIEVESASIGPSLSYIETDGNDVDLWFGAALSAGEETTLDGVVSSHVPNVEIGVGSYAEDDTESQTTSVTFVQKLRLTTASIEADKYYIHWCCSLSQVHKDRPIVVRLQLDDTTTIFEHSMIRGHNDVNYKIVSGFKRLDLTGGVHNFDIDYKVGDNETAKIKDVRLWIVAEP